MRLALYKIERETVKKEHKGRMIDTDLEYKITELKILVKEQKKKTKTVTWLSQGVKMVILRLN